MNMGVRVGWKQRVASLVNKHPEKYFALMIHQLVAMQVTNRLTRGH